MPATLSDDLSTRRTTLFGSGLMVLLKMMDVHRRPVTRGRKKCKVLAGTDILFHEVGRGRGFRENLGERSDQLHLGSHHMQVCGTKKDSL